MDTFNKLFGDIFESFGPLFDSKTPNYDWDKFSQTGKVTEEIKEANGYKTITKSYTSNDGKTKITSSESFKMIDDTAVMLKEIDAKLKKAVESEDFELAINLRNQKKELLNKKK